MQHGSLEVELDGHPIYVRSADIENTLKLGRASVRKLKSVVKEVVDSSVACGIILTNAEIVEKVRAHPDVTGVSKRRVEQIAQELKPIAWTKPGPRSRQSSS